MAIMVRLMQGEAKGQQAAGGQAAWDNMLAGLDLALPSAVKTLEDLPLYPLPWCLHDL